VKATTFIPHVVNGAGYSTEIVIYDLEGSQLTATSIFSIKAGTQ
jgi:hypothetical protein